MRHDRAGPSGPGARPPFLTVGLDGAMSEQVEPVSIESAWREIEIELAGARNRIYQQIRGYPPPITTCDEQFDYLLEQRQEISRELERMHEASAASLADREAAARIDQFIRSSSFIGDEARRRIRSSLRPGFSERRRR